MATAITPIGPAPVMSTSSPTTLKASAVCVALPSGSRIAAISSSMAAGSVNTLDAGIVKYSAKAPGGMTPAGAAIAAMPASDMSLAGYAIAGMKAAHLAAHLDDFSGIFVTDGHGHGYCLLRPGIPVVNVHIGATDGGAMHFDEYIIVAYGRFRDILHPDAGFRAGLDECFHGFSLMNHAEIARRAAKGGNDLIELLRRVCSIHLGTNSRFSMGYDREGKSHDINAVFLHPLSQLHGQGCLSQHYRNDRMLPGDQIEAQGLHPLAKGARVGMNALAKFRRALQKIQHLDGAGGDRRRDAVREQVGPRALAQPRDDFLAGCDKAAAGSPQGFAQRAG